MRCPHCGRETLEGRYCAYCGGQLPTNAPDAPGVSDTPGASAASQAQARRRHVFAAAPREHVYQPGLITTFFPHLSAHRTQQFRWILGALAVVVVLLGVGRYVPASIVAAALLVPVLYLVYFYVVEIYEDEPFWVLGATFLIGGVLGLIASIVLYRLIQREQSFFGPPSTQYILLTALVGPLVAQALMLVGPLILYVARPRFGEVLDGMVFGVASGLGFAAAQSIVYSWLLVTGPLQRAGSVTAWALPVIRIAILVPLLYAATTGLICAAIWLRRDATPPARSAGWMPSVPVAVGIALLGLILPSLAVDFGLGQNSFGTSLGGGGTSVPTQVLNLLWYALALLAIMLIVRQVLHVGLIDKAQALGHGGNLRCPNCAHIVPDVPFCPNCGIAMRSVAKRIRRTPSAPEAASEESDHIDQGE